MYGLGSREHCPFTRRRAPREFRLGMLDTELITGGAIRRRRRTTRRRRRKTTRRPTSREKPKVVYRVIYKPPPVRRSVGTPLQQTPAQPSRSREETWQHIRAAIASAQPPPAPIIIQAPPPPAPVVAHVPPMVLHPPKEEDIYYDAVSTMPSRRPADGEADSDKIAERKLSIDEVLDVLMNIPQRLRKTLLTSLFGVAVGAVLDMLLGSPLGLTSKIIRGLLRLIPGGWMVLSAMDGLGYLLGKGKDVLMLPYDPGFVDMANRIRPNMTERTAEDIARIADQQTGANTFTASLAALTSLLFRLPEN
ncbi:p32K [Psittacine adenovirus 3]|uniref:p32K n=1 Tax=Psittacine adenovirus 3 TaxID=1580497 RepID=A0A0A7JTH7_9ADEN|nr:p32K [Psittacine adenovirus 3]AIZ35762.1 p32K [Psittacine adenovirus 3]